MALFSHFLQKVSTFTNDAWSRRSQTSSVYDEFASIILTLALIVLAISRYAWLFVQKAKKGQPPLPPGPRGLPIVGNLPSLDQELHSYFASLGRTYGPILTLRLGQKLAVVVTSPAVAREVLKDHDITFANRPLSEVNRAMEHGGHDIVFTPYGPEWRMLRKVSVRGMLGGAALDTVHSLRRREIRNTMRYFCSEAGFPVNVGEQMFLTVFNVITNMLWGGTIQGKERTIIAAEFRQLVAEVTENLGKPNISDFFPALAWLDLQGIKKQMKGVGMKLQQIFDLIIDQRLKMDVGDGGIRREDSGKESKDFLEVLLQLKDEEDANPPLTMMHVKALLLDMVVGGTDTTSNTIEFAMAELMNRPEVMKKAQQELDTIVGKDNIVEESHIPKLPYLHAIMKEVLRLHPVLPLMVPHCPSKSSIVGGYTIPKGARVFINVWAIHRDPSIWKNASEFEPERFLNGNGDYSGKDFNYIPFGSGRRICAGIAMAERVVKFSLASLLHSFDWKLPKGEKMDIEEKFGIVLKKKIPLIAVPTPRLSDPTLYE